MRLPKQQRHQQQKKTLLTAPNVALALDNPTNDPSEEDMEASALDNRTVEEDAPIAEEVRVCCCGDNCINEEEEEGLLILLLRVRPILP